MAILFQDGFESGDFSAWTTIVGSSTIVTSPVHHGTYAMQCKANYRYVRRNDISTTTYHYCGVYFRTSDLLVNNDTSLGFMRAVETGVSEIAVVYLHKTAGGVTSIRLDSIYGDTNVPFDVVANVWHYVEFGFFQNNPNGWLKVWVDGILQITHSGNTSSYTCNSESVGIISINDVSVPTVNIDCVVVSDSYIGQEDMPTAWLRM